MPSSILAPGTINGTGTPRFTVVTRLQEYIADYDFPSCNVNGLVDESTKDSQLTELDSGELVEDIYGYRIKFTLDYSARFYGGYALMLKQLLQYEKQGYLIYFNPRVDVLNRKFKVRFTNNPISISPMPSGSGQFVFMRGVVIELMTIDLHDLNWIDATNLTHVFTNFAMAN